MATIYSAVESLIKPARIASAAAILNETEKKINSSADVILPSLVASLIKAGNDTDVRSVVEDAGKMKIQGDLKQIWEGHGIEHHKNIGERMENRLLGVESPKFNAAVAAHSGIKATHADRLTNWVATTLAGYLGEKIMTGKTYIELLDELEKEKHGLQKRIPARIIELLGLDRVFGPYAVRGAQKAEPEKSGLCRLWWLLGIFALAAVVFFCVRSCEGGQKAETVAVPTEQVVPASVSVAEPEQIKLTLPDGTNITAYRGGCEEAIVAFLDSKKFKNATDEQLTTVWFEFDRIDFEHNSATELMAGSQPQLKNIETILRHHPNVKVLVGAFADKTGTRAVNLGISRKRAENIKDAMIAAGVKADRISTEGFGETYAEVAENASDMAMAKDRDIAIRFTK